MSKAPSEILHEYRSGRRKLKKIKQHFYQAVGERHIHQLEAFERGE